MYCVVRSKGSMTERSRSPRRIRCLGVIAICSDAIRPIKLFDQFVCAREQRRRDRQPERLSDLDVNDQLELSRLLDGEVAGLSTLQDLVHEGGSPPEEVDDARPVRHQAPRIRVLTNGVYGRKAAASSQGGDP